MKKLLWILPLLIIASCNQPYQSPRGIGDKWYVATTGSDTDGDGSFAHPWKTLKHACDTITGAAFATDTIIVGAGTFSEPVQIALGVGVSIKGAGVATIITSGSALNPILLLASASEGTNGNQTISGLTFDGDMTAASLIKVFARSNVEIHHCTFLDSYYQGVLFYGRTDSLYQMTTTYSTGNSFHDNIVTNCAAWDAAHAWDKGRGNFCFGGQDGMLIYNNTITQPDRGGAANGHGIKFTNHGNHKGTKIYNNTVSVPQKKAATGSGGGYAFAFELWSQRGGIEIYDNNVYGCIDLGGYDTNDDGGYGYAIKVYRNRIGYDALSAYDHNAIHLELGFHGGTYIYQNHIRNISRPIASTSSSSALVQGQEDVVVSHNIFTGVRRAGAGWYGYCFDINPAVAYTLDDWRVLNNTVYSDAETLYAFMEANDATTTVTDMEVKNNIVVGAHEGVRLINGTVTNIEIENNDFYGVTNDTVFTNATVTGDVFQNNLDVNPLFKSNETFRLCPTSPCINAGTPVGLTNDFAGHRVPQNDTVDIGAYEYGNYLFRTPSGHLLRNANGKLMITH